MKKIKPVLWTLVLSSIFFSCSHGFLKDPRLYNSKDNTKQAAFVPAAEPDLGLTGGVDAFDKLNEWYNNPNSNGDADNPGKVDFPNTDFDNMSLVGTYFNDSNVPVYAMREGNVWATGDATKAEFVHANADNTTGQGYEISKVHWYQYRGRNPLFDATGAYNTRLQTTTEGNPKLSRFYFYRFTGKTLAPSLDNFLFAVDTYSKLMFAFAYPTRMESVLGNQVPKEWGPTDGEPFLGTSYQFYMYDPIGYVEKKDDGSYSVVMYEWFRNNLARGVYHPTLDGVNRDKVGTPYEDIAKKNPNGAGKSPFNNHTSDFFVENLKLLNGKAFIYRPEEDGHVNGSWLHTITMNTEGTEFTEIKEQYGTNDKQSARTFTYKSSTSATEGVFEDDKGQDWKVTLKDQSTKITFSSETEEFTVSTQPDPGPAWLIRVRGKFFSGSGYTYQFSDDGREIKLNNGKTYTYAQQDANDRAVYKADTLVFWGAKISENDTKITWTPTSWASAGTTPSSLANSSPARLVIELPSDPKFYHYVNSAVYSYREQDTYQGTDGRGHGLNLYSVTFSNGGKTAEISSTPWRGAKSITETITYDQPSDGEENKTSATYEGKTFTLEEEGHVLIIDGQKYYRSFNDPGPSFMNRVKSNPTFTGNGEIRYEFRNNGNNLWVRWNGAISTLDSTFNFRRIYDDVNRSRALYVGYDKWGKNWQGGWFTWGIELSENDDVIKMTLGGAEGSLAWGTLNTKAQRNN